MKTCCCELSVEVNVCSAGAYAQDSLAPELVANKFTPATNLTEVNRLSDFSRESIGCGMQATMRGHNLHLL